MSDTTTTNVATGDMFIIPNSLTTLSEMAPSARERIKRDLRRLNVNGFRCSEVDLDEALVQLWFTSPECDNWADHNWPGRPFYGGKANQYAGLTSYWPARALMGVEEGTKFVADFLDYKGGEWRLVLTPRQEGYRYRGRGSFEQLLRDLLARFRGRALQPWPA